MALCFIALFVFSVLGIFSSYYRVLAKEAFLCVFNKSTGKKCDAEFDRTIKAHISAKLGRISPALAKNTLRHFTIISYVFVLFFLVSTIYVLYGGVNFYLYGNCDGLESASFCLFDPQGTNVQTTTLDVDDDTCQAPLPGKQSALSLLNHSLFPTVGSSGTHFYFFGSYTCPYTQKMYPDFITLVEERDVTVTFVMIETHNNSLFNQVLTGVDDARIIEYNNLVFSEINTIYNPVTNEYDEEAFNNLLAENDFSININYSLYELQKENVERTSIAGTPTIYELEDDFVLLGPRPKRVYSRILR